MPSRTERIRAAMRQSGLAAVLLSAPSSLRYTFGFTGSNGIGLITGEHCYFVTDWRYRDQAQHEVRNAEILIAYRDLFLPLKEKQVLRPGQSLGFEEDHLTYRLVHLLRKHFPDLMLTMTDGMLGKLAMVKDAGELALLRSAAQLACKVWDQVLPLIRSGISESDIAAEIVYRGRKAGSQIEPFDPIVASGPRSALPHARSSSRKLAHRDAVVIDFGCVSEGYASDITRTIFVGEPSEKLKQAYHAVKAAGELAYHFIRPMMKAIELDQQVRKHFESVGLGTYFNHSLGHGIGLAVHSLPKIGPESKDIILPGAVVAIEPGVYLPDIGGVRIEDDVLVTDKGVEILTPITREMICVE